MDGLPILSHDLYKTYRTSMRLYFLGLKTTRFYRGFTPAASRQVPATWFSFKGLSHDEYQRKLVIEPNLMPFVMGLVYLPRFG